MRKCLRKLFKRLSQGPEAHISKSIWILKTEKKKIHSTSHYTFAPPPLGPSCDFPITGNLDVIGKINVSPNQLEAQPMGSIPQYQNDKQIATTTVANSILYRVQVSQSNPLKDISPYVSDQTLRHPFFRGLWPRLRPLRDTWLNPVP